MSSTRGNSTCRHVGHEWRTIAANYRYCTRQHCTASERLQDGVWVSNAPFYRTHQPVVPTTERKQPRQAAMWDSDQERS